MDPAVCWGLATGPHRHRKQCLLPLGTGKISSCMSKPSMDCCHLNVAAGLFPLPAEEACGHVVGGHIHAISKPKKNSSIGFKMVSKGASIPLQLIVVVNQPWTRAARWKLTLSHITTNLGWSGLFCTTILWRASRNGSICWLLYGPSFAWWCRALEGLWRHTMWYFPALPWDVHNCPLANYITTPSSCFAQVESSFINENEFMRLCSSIHGQDSL